MMPQGPEATGKAMAEALVARLDALKAELQGRAGDSHARQAVAGEAAVEALKQVLGGLTAGWMPADAADPPARPTPPDAG